MRAPHERSLQKLEILNASVGSFTWKGMELQSIIPFAFCAEMDWTLERVDQLLQRLHATLGEERQLTGQALGQRLRLLEPSFHARVLGDPKLSVLLQRFPERGEVQLAAGGNFIFRFHESGVLAAPGRSSSAYLLKPVWNQLLLGGSEPARCFIDLAHEGLVEAPLEDRSDPHRYLAVPVLPQQRVLAAAAACVSDVHALDLQALEGAPDAFVRLDAWMERHQLKTIWRAALRHEALGFFEAWCRAHGLDVNRYQQTRQSRPRVPRDKPRAPCEAVSEALAPSPGEDGRLELRPEELRTLLLNAVGQMSLEELLALPIPPRYLLKPTSFPAPTA